MLNWKQWLTALANAAISGLASGLASGVAGLTWKQALVVAGTSALVSVAKWTMQHPLPGTPSGS